MVKDTLALGNTGHKKMTDAIEKEMAKIYVPRDTPGLERHPKGFLAYPYVHAQTLSIMTIDNFLLFR